MGSGAAGVDSMIFSAPVNASDFSIVNGDTILAITPPPLIHAGSGATHDGGGLLGLEGIGFIKGSFAKVGDGTSSVAKARGTPAVIDDTYAAASMASRDESGLNWDISPGGISLRPTGAVPLGSMLQDVQHAVTASDIVPDSSTGWAMPDQASMFGSVTAGSALGLALETPMGIPPRISWGAN